MKSRGQLLFETYLGLGGLALSGLLASESARAASLPPDNPLAPKPPHHPAKAKSCIFLFMEGGVSQMDLFEYKPELIKYAGKQMPPGTVSRAVGCPACFRTWPPEWTISHSFTALKWITTTTVPPFITPSRGTNSREVLLSGLG